MTTTVEDEIKAAKNKVRQFLNAWKAADADELLSHCTKTWRSMHGSNETIGLFGELQLHSYRTKKIQEKGAVIDITCEVKTNSGSRVITMRLIKEMDAFEPNLLHGEWGVNPISATKNLFEWQL